MTHKKSLPALLAFVVMTTLACTTLQVQTDYDQRADFSSYTTYSWLPEPAKTGHPRDTSLLHRRLREAIDEVLALRGMRPKGRTSDVWIGYHLSVERRLDYQVVDTYYGYRQNWPPTPEVAYATEYEQGTLIIDVIDAKTKELVWRGVGSKRVASNPDPADLRKNVREVVEQLLATYPPQP